MPDIALICGSVLAALFLAESAGAAQTLSFKVAAGAAPQTIAEFADEANVQIIYKWDDIAAIKTQAVVGSYELREALRVLLAGTGLTFELVDSGSVVIFERQRSRGRAERVGDAAVVETPAKEPVTVVVDASRMPGDIVAVIGADPLKVGREDIEHSPVTTTPDLLAILPQNFGGGPNENTIKGEYAETNSGIGSGVNLRGLSDGATVVLLNGRRLSPSGTAGAFVDISNIPLSAIDHMEVVPGGVTGLYGVDAIGGIVNFVTRQDTGLETRAEVGGLARSAPYEERFSQSWGGGGSSGKLFALFEYDERDDLPASRRTLATSDLMPFGGQNFDTPYGAPGNMDVYGIFLAIPAGQNGRALSPSQLVPGTENLYNRYAGATVLPRQQLSSFVLTGEQEVGASTGLFVDLLLAARRARSVATGEGLTVVLTPENPFYVAPLGTRGPVLVSYGLGSDLGPVVTQVGVNTGQLTVGLDHDGGVFDHLEAYASYAYERQEELQVGLVNPLLFNEYLNGDPNPATALNVLGNGASINAATLAAVRATADFALISRLASANVTADRVVCRLPGGDVLVTWSAEYRRQSLGSLSESPGADVAADDFGRTTLSAFVEGRVPIVGRNNALAGVEALGLSGAARLERYSDVGKVVAPLVAMAYSPWRGILLRTSWARLFHAPDLLDLAKTGSTSALTSLATSSGSTTALVWSGGNPSLRPETANTWTAGANVSPPMAPALSLGLTYFHTDFTNRIDTWIPLSANVLEESAFRSLLLSVTERADVCAHSQFIGPAGECLSAPVGAIVDLRARNVASLDTQGVDVTARYELGRAWKLGLNATYLFQYAQRPLPWSAPENLLNTDHNPIDLKLRASLSWQRWGLWARGAVNFQNSYEDVDSVPHRRISSWSTVDVAVGYDLPFARNGPLEKMRFSVGARNLFNQQPPFLNNQYGIGYDQENANLVGRVVSFGVQCNW